MRFVISLTCILIAYPAAGAVPEKESKKQTPESLLPGDSLLYFRYDGYEPHRRAYEQTALGKAMRDDLGEFLEYLGGFAAEQITNNIKDKNPEDMQKLAGAWRKFSGYLWRHGLAAGLQVRTPPGTGSFFPEMHPRLTVIFPEGGVGKNRDAILPVLTVLAPGVEKQVGTRGIHEAAENGNHYAWWQEGRHLVLVWGSDKLEGLLDVVEGRRPGLDVRALCKTVGGFKDYETDIRGFVDIRKLVDLLRAPGNAGVSAVTEWAAKSFAFNQLGLTSVNSLTFHLGFERQYQRSTIVLNVAEREQRAGLARLVFAPVQLAPAKLPPLPPDAVSVRISEVDWKVLYNVIQRFVKLASMQNLFSEGGFKDWIKGVDLGVDIHKEVLPHLDSTLILYNSLSEGPFTFGQGAAIKVKDEKKLAAGLDKLARGLLKLSTGLGIDLQKKTYRGIDMSVVSLPSPLPLAPTFVVHKGWLYIGAFPQSVKGCILRSEGKHKVWQPPALLEEALAAAKKRAGPNSKLAAVTVTDPRPAMTVGLSLLPLLGQAIGAAGVSFDVTKIPSAQAVTEWQFPGVTVFYDDGNALRWESHSSIEAPGDLLFLGYGLASLAGGFFF